MSSMGVYTWIREGVKHAVLLGFSDAVEQIGVPIEGNVLNTQMAAVLLQGVPAMAESPTATLPPPQAAGRKRLGKSFEQMRKESNEAA
jgi:hypothetical protein